MKCSKHPNYMVKKYPYSECPECLEMWKEHVSTTFTDVDLDLDDETVDKLIRVFVMRLQPASQSVFYDHYKNLDTIKDALYDAIINEVVLDSLKRVVEEDKNAT